MICVSVCVSTQVPTYTVHLRDYTRLISILVLHVVITPYCLKDKQDIIHKINNNKNKNI